MRLKNKRTGEIGYLYEHSLLQDIIIVYDVKGIVGKYTSLAELNEEWEDVPEEPKEYWFIENDGDISSIGVDEDFAESLRASKEIGNYFETKEEAEKAVEKLKALKRLKDKGFRFRWIDMQTGQIKYSFYLEDGQKITRKDEDDLLLLFGGEE